MAKCLDKCSVPGCIYKFNHVGSCCWTFESAKKRKFTEPDLIKNPSHYIRKGIEVRKVISAFELTYHCGDALAYILRAKFKGNYKEDLAKAIQHLQFELEEHESKEGK